MNCKRSKGVPIGVAFVLYLFFVLGLSSSMAQTQKKSEQKEILVIGSSIIVDGNIARAREAAISEALLKGVEAYLARRLGSEGMINNFPRLLQETIPAAREEIENFHILAEDQAERHYRVLVRLKVNEKMMEEKFRESGLILAEGPPVKILFLVSQVEPRTGKILYWWQDPENDPGLTPTDLILHRVFQERGFSPINRLLIAPEGDVLPEMKALELSYGDTIEWGRALGADVVIQGTCTIVEDEQVSVTLSSVDIGKGAMIGRGTQTEMIDKSSGSTQQIMLPMEKAIKKVAAELGPAIIRAIELPEASTRRLEVVLKGLRSFTELRQIQDFLRQEVVGVSSVRQSRVTGQTISLLVEFDGDENKFLERLSNHEDFPLQADVNQSEQGEIVIQIR